MSVNVHVLGTAQDGGFPHAGCGCAACERARRDPSLQRRVSSIGVVGETGKCLIVDATPDFSVQQAALTAAAGRRPPHIDAMILTHAHIGHYLGLALLGREAMSADAVPVYCTRSMRHFLEHNRPWSHLIERGEVNLHTIAPGEHLDFDGTRIHAFLTPHRSEDTDTIGLDIVGPERRLVYVSDADVFPPALAERINDADVALIDGTFYDRDELPHREILAVRHPFVTESVERFADAQGRVIFIHLNHTNALLSETPPDLPEGFAVAREGDSYAL
jgi:pyrroloquinoline quinone biosynthesis protein B